MWDSFARTFLEKKEIEFGGMLARSPDSDSIRAQSQLARVFRCPSFQY